MTFDGFIMLFLVAIVAVSLDRIWTITQRRRYAKTWSDRYAKGGPILLEEPESPSAEDIRDLFLNNVHRMSLTDLHDVATRCRSLQFGAGLGFTAHSVPQGKINQDDLIKILEKHHIAYDMVVVPIPEQRITEFVFSTPLHLSKMTRYLIKNYTNIETQTNDDAYVIIVKDREVSI